MSERDTKVMEKDETFLGRWSRRKRADAAQPPAETPAETTGEPMAADDELPPPEELGAESDYAGFMRDGVPSELRRRALRQLWHSDPARFAPDGLVEYGRDYTKPALVGAAVKTAFCVAKGARAAEGGTAGIGPTAPSTEDDEPGAASPEDTDETPDQESKA